MHGYRSESLTPVYRNDHWSFFPFFFFCTLGKMAGNSQSQSCLRIEFVNFRSLCHYFTQAHFFFSSVWLLRMGHFCYCRTFKVALSCWCPRHKSRRMVAMWSRLSWLCVWKTFCTSCFSLYLYANLFRVYTMKLHWEPHLRTLPQRDE